MFISSRIAASMAALFLIFPSASLAQPIANTDPCLDCHTTDGPPEAPNIDAEFDDIGSHNNRLMSQHSIRYDEDGDLGAKSDNECRKCHGAGHPTKARFLVYPDKTNSHEYGEAIPKAAAFKEYEDFCIACHDGEDMGEENQWEQIFTGPSPAQQATPTDPSNPALQQRTNADDRHPANGAWQAAPVPQRDAPPYFGGAKAMEYYVGNGHGSVDPTDGASAPTCLGAGGKDGCHSAHGSKNRFLLFDNNPRIPDLDEDISLGPATTIGELDQNFCLGCHDLGDNTEGLHRMAGLHVGTFLWSGGARKGEMIQTGSIGFKNKPFGEIATATMPFYKSAEAKPEDRIYRDSVHPQVGVDEVHCPTCHDPHGTAKTSHHNDYYESHGGDPTPTTKSMLRKFPIYWLYDIENDPLCGECHVVEQPWANMGKKHF